MQKDRYAKESKDIYGKETNFLYEINEVLSKFTSTEF